MTIHPLPDTLKELALAGYREIVAANRMMYAESGSTEHLERAEYAERRIAGLERDGTIDWEMAT
jgi:hypothetical protein